MISKEGLTIPADELKKLVDAQVDAAAYKLREATEKVEIAKAVLEKLEQARFNVEALIRKHTPPVAGKPPTVTERKEA